MKDMGWLIAAIAVLAVLGALAGGKAKGKGRGEKPRAKKLLTEREQAMYSRLIECFPDRVILAQVSLGALLTAKATATRNTFDRKIADFVLCSRACEVMAVIELDDHSHRGKGAKDSARDKMLTEAGYKTIRFKNVPDRSELIAAVSAALTEPKPDTLKKDSPTSPPLKRTTPGA